MEQVELHSVTPHLVCEGAAAALEFYGKAFNASEIMRMPGKEGRLMHAAIQIGDSVVMLADDFPEYGGLGPKALKGSPVTLHLKVANVDASYAQALAAGAQSRMEPADMFWGDRYAQVTDPFGHHWALAQHIRDVSQEEMLAAMQQSQPPCE